MQDEQAARNIQALKKKEFEIKFDLRNSNYEAVENIGTGAYGVVCSAIHKVSNVRVAIKKIPDIFDQSTIAKRTYREIKILKHFKHDNIISIQEILKPTEPLTKFKDVYIVLDLMESDMHRVIHSKQELTDEHVQYFLYQILRGLKYILSANIIHRDLKPSNLLVNENCDLKIGDFGMARAISSDPEEYNFQLTQYVATRWYRAPEIMMGQVSYSGAVDMWSVGCIFAEMLGRRQLFPGKDYVHQIMLIIGILGSPGQDFLRHVKSDNIKNFIQNLGAKKPEALNKLYPKAKKKALDLLAKMLILDPNHRISVESALKHPYLNNYHDPDDEPVCIPVFDFAFEKKMLDNADLKSEIVSEIMEYHKHKEKPRLTFNFRPVPASELQKTPSPRITPNKTGLLELSNTKPGESNRAISQEILDKQLEHFRRMSEELEVLEPTKCSEPLVRVNDLTEAKPKNMQLMNSNTVINSKLPAPKVEKSVEKLKTETVDVDKKRESKLQISHDNVAKQLDHFHRMSEELRILEPPKPSETTEVKIHVTKVRTENLQPTQSDIEMLSAKLSAARVDEDVEDFEAEVNKLKAVDIKGTEVVDVDMPSAKKADKEVQEEPKPLNAKEVLKHALLNARLAKQKGEEKPRPITALQRQKEREERKKKKVPTATLR